MQTIYVDVLIILNIYINFLLIKTTSKITRSPLKFIRCILASFYGSLFSLLILFPHLNCIINILIKILAAVSIIIIAFGINNKHRIILNSIAFFIVNFIFAGAVYAVYSWLKPSFMHFNNTYFYIDFSLFILIGTTSVLYGAVCIMRYLFDRVPEDAGCYTVIIRYKGRLVSIKGIADTGNALVDFFSGKPVIVCGKNKLYDVTGHDSFNLSANQLPKGFRLLPCSTITENGILPIFNPDEIVILNSKTHIKKPVEALIGFGSECSEAIFNPKILRF